MLAEREGCQEQEAFCPSCEQPSHFIESGVQKWPPRVAQAAGLPEVIQLWQCKNCHTTISEIDLHF